jgi:signal peptidase I
MNWEIAGWLALAISGAIILAALFIRKPVDAADQDAGHGHALHLWLEIAWPVFFIAVMGMLTLKEVLSFAAVLLLATVITGILWLIDIVAFRRKRAGVHGEPVLVEMARSFFPVILIVFLLRSFLFEPFKIPSGSMVPSLLVGDFILVNKYTYGIRLPVINKKIVEMNSPKRSDVMVFRYPENPGKDFIKRVVGLPGDVISYKNKQLTVNGRLVPREKTGLFTEVDDRMNMRQFEAYRESLGEKPHLMMVDPRMASINLGSVREFQNKNNCVYNEEGMTCKVPAGHYFMMGDSRDNSDDGRYWGFVPEQNIVGKAVLIWMNFGHLKRIGLSIE